MQLFLLVRVNCTFIHLCYDNMVGRVDIMRRLRDPVDSFMSLDLSSFKSQSLILSLRVFKIVERE